MRWRVAALAGVAVLLVIGLIAIRSNRHTGASVGAGDGLPGDRLRAYLGLDISPREWNEELTRLGTSSVCGQGSAPVVDAVQLRFDEPVEYASRYGYGIVQSLIDDAVDYGPTIDPLPSREVAAGSAACADLVARELGYLFAPPEVHHRVGALLEASARDGRFVEARQRWSSCLFDRGIDATNPLDLSDVVLREFARLEAAESGQASSRPAPTDELEYGDGERLLPPAEVLNLAQQFELTVFELDRECKSSTGLTALMLDLETEMLEAIRREFPNFAGIHYGSPVP